MKFCKDCKWIVPSELQGKSRYARCANPEVNRDESDFLIDGTDCTFAAIAREKVCGQDAIFFEPALPRKSFWDRVKNLFKETKWK